jgi:hypothetical protein
MVWAYIHGIMKLRWAPWLWYCVLALAGLGPIVQANDYSNDPFDPVIARDAWLMISAAERQYQIPSGLLHAISLVETGKGVHGWMLPWPYTVGVNGTGTQTFRNGSDALGQLNAWRGLGFVRFNLNINGRSFSNLKATEATTQLLALGSTFAFITLEGRNFARRFSDAASTEQFLLSMFARGYRNVDVGMMQINWKVHGHNFRSVAEVLVPANNLRYAVSYLLTHRQTRDWWGSVGRYHSGTSFYANRYVRNVYGMYMRIHRYNNNA